MSEPREPFTGDPITVSRIDPAELEPMQRAFAFGGMNVHTCPDAPPNHIYTLDRSLIDDGTGHCRSCGGELP